MPLFFFEKSVFVKHPSEDQEEVLVHLRLADRESQLFLCPQKHRKHSALLRPIGAAFVIGKVALDFLQPVIL